MTATCGRTSLKQFAFYDPDGSCWRTWPAISLWGSETYSATWPKRGSMRSGACYEHPTWAPPTAELASSSLLPTPVVNDMGAGKTVEWWDDWTAEMKAKHSNGNGHGPSLAIEAQRLLPTPKTHARASRKALTQQHWSAPALEQAIELAQGTLPREYESWDEVQGWHGDRSSQPSPAGKPSSDDTRHLPPTNEDD